MEATNTDDSNGDKDNKPLLSHTVSLPSSSPLRQPSLTTPKSGRSKSVKDKPPNKVWSFGDMAKAVGCGVTAFGSNVVSSSKAVGSGVIHGSVAMGNNVVEVTRDVTRDVTKGVVQAGELAGKGVAQAGELVGSAAISTVQVGKEFTSASVSAVQDTRKWMSEQADIVSSSDIKQQTVHVVLPGEDLAKISTTYHVPTHNLIRANSLRQRKLLPGRQIVIPKSKESVEDVDHPMDWLRFERCFIIEGDALNSKQLATVTFGVQYIDVATDGGEKMIPWQNVSELRLDNGDDDAKSAANDDLPDLLPAEDLPAPNVQDDTGGQAISQQNDREIRTLTFLGHDEDSKVIMKLRLDVDAISQIHSHVCLWHPEKIDAEQLHGLAVIDLNRGGGCHDQAAQAIIDDLISPGASASKILTKPHMKEIHNKLNNKLQTLQWHLVYSTALDGYSLQNFYRTVGAISEPFLLVMQDAGGDIFGAFLTCTPCITEEFLGTGQSWLFDIAVADNAVSQYEWSGANEYFFQGRSNCMIIGAADGKFGIFVDGNLHHGRVDQCDTFADWPKRVKDFRISCFECFCFK